MFLPFDSQFFNEAGLRVGRVTTSAVAPDGGSGMEEVDPEVGVVALHRLRHVLDHADVERNRNAEDRKNDRLVFFI